MLGYNIGTTFLCFANQNKNYHYLTLKTVNSNYLSTTPKDFKL